MVTAGPGSTNTITGVAGAWLDSSPVLFLSGQVKRADLKTGTALRNRGVQEVDIVSMVQSITKYAVTVTDPQSIRYHLEKALYLAQQSRTGPVWLDLPLDVQAATIEPASLAGFEPPTIAPPSLATAVSELIGDLNRSDRPFLLLGNGVRMAQAGPQVAALVETLNIPVGLTWPAMDLLPDTHPLVVGRPGPIAPRGANFALQNSDFFLSIGARLDLVCTAFAPEKLARAAIKTMVDVDPAELAKLQNYFQRLLCADAGDFIQELIRQRASLQARDRTPWLHRCQDWKKRYPLVTSAHRAKEAPLSMFYFTEFLSQTLQPGDLIIPTSSGSAIETFLLAFQTKERQRIFITTGLGPMGFGLPSSIGGCLAHQGKRTICIEADGGLQMNVQELETISRLGLPIKVFVINNQGYSSMVTSQKNYFGRFVGANPASGLTLPDTLAIAQAYRLPAHRIRTKAELEEKLSLLLAEDGPAVIEVFVDPDEPREPRVASQQRPDGTMVSKPLEDLYPFLPRDEFAANMLIEMWPD
jgi:acetolactate synthase-1/2/3 large subunit